ncbi:MAG TPA: chromate resistance protein ChrB domain-containing protein [Rhodocyclaceae bacterium]|jgi:hypothetical protein|nr:chromate resistance protein ChrB domain-containing protein [Rhodocyclaceae bacterium]
MTPEPWLVLVCSLPTSNAATRMRVWRATRALGCAPLRDGVWLLPESPRAQRAFAELARAVGDGKGQAHVLRVASADPAQEAAFRDLFDRTAEYRSLIEAIRAAAGDPAAAVRALPALQRELAAIAAIDYFPGEAQAQARAAIEELAAPVSPDEPRAAAGAIPRLDKAAYRGRTWATRRNMWVDRMASAWLIRRFIDPAARFVWLARPQDCPKRALGFDFDGADFSHAAGRVTFEVLAASFGLDDDPALRRIGALVHYLDAGGIEVDAAAGVEAILAGARAQAPHDDDLLESACHIFDFLYAAERGQKR